MDEGFNFSTIASYVIYLILFIMAIVAMYSFFVVHHEVTFNYDKDFKYANTVAKYLATSSCFVYRKNNTYPLPYVIDLEYIKKYEIKQCVPLNNYELIFYIPSLKNADGKPYFVDIVTNKGKQGIKYAIPYPVLYFDKGNFYSGLMVLRVFDNEYTK